MKHSRCCANTCYVTNCTVVLKLESILYFFFCSLWKRAVREQQRPYRLSLPKVCKRLHRWCVCEHKHMSDACLSVGCPESYRPSISSTNHFVSSTPPRRLCLISSFQSPIRYFFAGMKTFARNPKSTQFQISRILNFQPHKIWSKGRYYLAAIFQRTPG